MGPGLPTSPTFLPAYLFSLRLAFATMVIATVLGTMTAIFLSRVAFPGRGAVRAFFLAPLMLPGLVIGLSLYVYYRNFPLLDLSGTFWGMMSGHVLVTTPFVIGTVLLRSMASTARWKRQRAAWEQGR